MKIFPLSFLMFTKIWQYIVSWHTPVLVTQNKKGNKANYNLALLKNILMPMLETELLKCKTQAYPYLARYLLLIKDTNTHIHTVYMNSSFVKMNFCILWKLWKLTSVHTAWLYL